MSSKDVVSGVGVRKGELFLLDTTTGLPSVVLNSGTLQAATSMQGIKTFDYNDPDPQKFTHYGQDRPFAQDSLPATEVGSFTITTAKNNMVLDTLVDGTTEVTLDGSLKARAGNTNKKGSEPQVMLSVYRQALDTTAGSSTFGKLRQWHLVMVPSTRIISKLSAMNQGITDKSYSGIPTPVTSTPWGQGLTDGVWGATQAEYLELTADYQPVSAAGLGNGTLATFGLPTNAVPVDTAHTHVWVNGTIGTVSAVGTSTTAPTFTLSAAPGLNTLVYAIVETLSTQG